MFKCLNAKMLKCRGFTLIEILVSLFIIVLISGIIFANYRQSGQQFALQRSANKLAQDIRRAQQMAMSAKEFEGTAPRGGYGIYFNTNTSETSYILFADCNEDHRYQPNGSALDCASATLSNPYPEKIEEIELEKGVRITQLVRIYNKNSDVTSNLVIVFTPPDPIVWINATNNSDGLIYLESEDKAILVKVTSNGLIAQFQGEEYMPSCSCWYEETGCSDNDTNCGGCPPDNPPYVFWDCCHYEYICTPPDCCNTNPNIDCQLDYWECKAGGTIK